MTENEEPTNHDPSNEDAAWFREHVDPVVGSEVPDAWDDIRSRATGRHPILIPLPKTEARPWPGRRLVAVAALLLVAVGVIGVGMKLVGSDDEDQRPADPVDLIGEDDDVTGFYVPGTLPDGWKVTSIYISGSDSGAGNSDFIACPCSSTEFERGSERYTTVTSAGGPEQLGSFDGSRWTAEQGVVDSGRIPLDDRAGWYQDGRRGGTIEPAMVVWHTAAGSRAVASASLDRSELKSAAEAWTTDDPPMLDGYQLADSWAMDHPILTRHSVNWTIENAETGAIAHVDMSPKMLGFSVLATSTFALPGNDLPAATLPNDLGIVASWPGSTELEIQSWGDLIGDGPNYTAAADPATMKAILGSFRPADATAWRNHLTPLFLDQNKFTEEMDFVVEQMDQVRTERIGDWLVGPEPGTALPKRKVEVIYGDPDDPRSSASIAIESDVDHVSVAAGEQFTIGLTMSNRTGESMEESGCSFGTVTWSLIDEYGLVSPAGARDVFCDPSVSPWPDGEQQRQTFDFPGQGQSMLGEGPIAAVIEFGHVTVIIPGHVGL